MIDDEILLNELVHGESKKLEFKENLPSDSRKYIKTVVAFANTAGGKLVVGVNDDRKIIGLPRELIFSIKDSISDTISHMCEPQIVPDIYVADFEDKKIIVVEIYPGSNCPYYIKSQGLQDGTYVRISGTSRLADQTVIKELQMRGSNLRFDEVANMQYPVEQNSIDRLCRDIFDFRQKKSSPIDIQPDLSITPKDLINWKLLMHQGKDYIATNAFVLLTSDFFENSKIQCARFKGINRTVFIDKKDYSGPLYEQIENAYNFVLNHINLSLEIDGLQRSEHYELPIRSIREMIVNAVTHRNYMIDSCIQVAVFDDRIEVTSPGMLYGSLDIAAIKTGRSETRNRTIARFFDKMRLIESWGTGIRRIMEECANAGLPEPKFSEIGDAFRVEVYRNKAKVADHASDHASDHEGTRKITAEKINELIEYCSTPKSRDEMQTFVGLSNRDYFRKFILSKLLEQGLIKPTIPDKPTSSNQKYIKVNEG